MCSVDFQVKESLAADVTFEWLIVDVTFHVNTTLGACFKLLITMDTVVRSLSSVYSHMLL